MVNQPVVQWLRRLVRRTNADGRVEERPEFSGLVVDHNSLSDSVEPAPSWASQASIHSASTRNSSAVHSGAASGAPSGAYSGAPSGIMANSLSGRAGQSDDAKGIAFEQNDQPGGPDAHDGAQQRDGSDKTHLAVNGRKKTVRGGKGDTASILTIASSSKRRRRRSIDTNASTRAIASESIFSNDAASVASHRRDTASIASVRS